MVFISPVNLKILTLQLLIGVFATISFIKLGHYLIYPAGWMDSSPSAIMQMGESQLLQGSISAIDWMKAIQNILLFITFYLQHIQMAKLKFKLSTTNIWPNFPIYERLIYNLTSSILLIIILQLQQPQAFTLFTLNKWICYPLAIAGVTLLATANLQMEQSIIFPYKFSELLGSRQVQVKQNDYEQIEQKGITIKGAYSLVRHPMQGGTILLLVFGNPIFTFQKIIILASIIIFIIIGVNMEEKRLLQKFKQYQNYKNIVIHKFIPYLI